MGYWPLLIVSGEAKDLSHLEPFEFQCLPRDHAQPITLNVRFNDHCFTTGFAPAKHDPSDIMPTRLVSKTEVRVFCRERYKLSFRLPELIKAFGGKRIASTRDGNLVRVESPDGQTYAIFFTMRKQSATRVNLFVVSAYPVGKGKKVADTGEMKFDIALAKILRGKKARFPNR
ncbi:hypothetical protein [Asticcacaulis benevestitus]|uniref:Uncharacterized protein n=1 Tax=Asticcacaulis benevestitus DSM 16100 = ATCC BAA-896 TaxID=1121022 RepID=V4RQ71_9CAUL|nr:hypothetical protein [Asticcacaulis benevestitus]ESQ93373.1 hypothetical protein ABENE_05590 [Asticcacaulis benevestitus DSM 16100 = ATCC BAA-896]